MKEDSPFSKRQKEVIDHLLQGKVNKQIALALGISERTVEFHLKNVYNKLHVNSAKEAILILGKSTVGKAGKHVYRQEKPIWKYEREARFPDEHTVGQTIARSNAYRQEVHGLFGAAQAWPARSGFVRYENILVPKNKTLYLKLRYSKHSPPSVPISIFLDAETTPRASLFPEDQGNWDHFKWTDYIPLGKVTQGMHSITFHTEGQEFGVADLDKFVLTTKPPPSRR